VLNELF